MNKFTHWLWHGFLRRPYRLTKPIDAGSGAPVLLLHGVASSSVSWQRTIEYLAEIPARIVAIDLLGFGKSPKPRDSDYGISIHAKTVIHAIDRLRLKRPVVLVGHSMGCLVAVHVAKMRPDLVKKLILYEIPLYEGLPAKRRYNLRRDLYYAMYRRITRYPHYSPANVRALQKIVVRVMGFEVTHETWNSFVRSLKNTVMAQTTLEDMKVLKTPTEIIYGSLDIVVIRGKPKNFFGANAEHISARSIREVHGISPRASMFLAGRIAEAIGLSESQIVARLPKYKRYLKSPKTKIVKAKKS